MYETCNEESCNGIHKLGGSSKEEDMELMDLFDVTLEEFLVPCDMSSKENPTTNHLIQQEHEHNGGLMMLLDEALVDFVPIREASHAAFLVSKEVMDIIHVNDSLMHIDILETILTEVILPIDFVVMGIWDFLLLCYEKFHGDAVYLTYDL
ncbi:hypothetical protein L7F22_008559 [Adiantum nelumboides]|nr:hypothetical protein [Adiantum nelumboides]